jgi:hypothetical protein
MTIAQELDLCSFHRVCLRASRLNRVDNAQGRVDEIVHFIESDTRYLTLQYLSLDEAPIEETLGHRVSQAIVSNNHFIVMQMSSNVALPWIASRGTLVHMTNLYSTRISVDSDTSIQDWNALLSLLLTSASLSQLRVSFKDRCDDALMGVFAQYLRAGSIRFLRICIPSLLSETAFASFCEGVAQSSLHSLALIDNEEADLEKFAECLGRAIAESSLEEVGMDIKVRSALSSTIPVKDLDFVFSPTLHVVEYPTVKINRKWKHLLNANIPLGMWSHILERAHSSTESSHGPLGILFCLLRQRPDLVRNHAP